MPRIKFLEDFDYKPIPMQTYSYKKNDVALVTQEIANKAIAANKAEPTDFDAPPAGINDTIGKFKNTRTRKSAPVDKAVAKEENEILDEAPAVVSPALNE